MFRCVKRYGRVFHYMKQDRYLWRIGLNFFRKKRTFHFYINFGETIIYLFRRSRTMLTMMFPKIKIKNSGVKYHPKGRSVMEQKTI